MYIDSFYGEIQYSLIHESYDNGEIKYVMKKDESDDFGVELIFIYDNSRLIGHFDNYCWELVNPFRLSEDFHFIPIEEGVKDNVKCFVCNIIHDDFNLMCYCEDKDYLAEFVSFVVYPEKPSRDLFVKELRRLDNVLNKKKREALDIENEIRSLERRYNLEGYNVL